MKNVVDGDLVPTPVQKLNNISELAKQAANTYEIEVKKLTTCCTLQI